MRARAKDGYDSRLFQYFVALLIVFAFILDVVEAQVSLLFYTLFIYFLYIVVWGLNQGLLVF